MNHLKLYKAKSFRSSIGQCSLTILTKKGDICMPSIRNTEIATLMMRDNGYEQKRTKNKHHEGSYLPHSMS